MAGVASIAIPRLFYKDRTEDWMKQVIPMQIPGYKFLAELPSDKQVYDILKPFGIVDRAYVGPDNRTYEFTTITGNSRKSFHDPQVCFSAQNWELLDPTKRDVLIPVLGGNVPATVVGLRKPGAKGLAMYFYKTPFGFRAVPLYMPFDLTAAKLLMKEDVDGKFYRFILEPSSDDFSADLQALETFANAVLAAVKENPGGDYWVPAT
jgi:hypothetical protein